MLERISQPNMVQTRRVIAPHKRIFACLFVVYILTSYLPLVNVTFLEKKTKTHNFYLKISSLINFFNIRFLFVYLKTFNCLLSVCMIFFVLLFFLLIFSHSITKIVNISNDIRISRKENTFSIELIDHIWIQFPNGSFSIGFYFNAVFILYFWWHVR